MLKNKLIAVASASQNSSVSGNNILVAKTNTKIIEPIISVVSVVKIFIDLISFMKLWGLYRSLCDI